MLALDKRKVIANVCSVEQLVDPWLQEERLAKSKIRGCGGEIKPHSCIRHTRRVDSAARAVFTTISKVRFVQRAVGNGIDPVCANRLNLGRTFNAVCRRSVRRHVKSLIGIFGPVKVVGPENLVFGVQIVVHPAKDSGIPHLVNKWLALIRVRQRRKVSSLKEIHQHLALAVRDTGDRSQPLQLGVANASIVEDRVCDAARCSQGSTEIASRQILTNALGCRKEK